MNTNSLPLVSIVVPSFNQGQFIEDTLISILGQDYPRLEVLVMDGGSTDSTLEILGRYKNRIQYISEPDEGQSSAINKGFRLARGEIVGWLNSDDLYMFRNTISQAVASFSHSSRPDIVFGDYIRINEANRFLRAYHTWRNFNFNRLLRGCYISQPTVFFRSVVIKNEQLDESLHFGMDMEYWLRLGKAGYSFKHLGRIVAAERIHANAKTVARLNESVRESIALCKKHVTDTKTLDTVLRRSVSDRAWMAYFRLKSLPTLLSLYLRRDTLIQLDFEKLPILVIKQFI